MKATIRAGAHIEGLHWVAEYFEERRKIRVLREGREVCVYAAPSALFGAEPDIGAKSCADHRAGEAALLANLKQFVTTHDGAE